MGEAIKCPWCKNAVVRDETADTIVHSVPLCRWFQQIAPQPETPVPPKSQRFTGKLTRTVNVSKLK